jgi:hypothetical protein
VLLQQRTRAGKLLTTRIAPFQIVRAHGECAAQIAERLYKFLPAHWRWFAFCRRSLHRAVRANKTCGGIRNACEIFRFTFGLGLRFPFSTPLIVARETPAAAANSDWLTHRCSNAVFNFILFQSVSEKSLVEILFQRARCAQFDTITASAASLDRRSARTPSPLAKSSDSGCRRRTDCSGIYCPEQSCKRCDTSRTVVLVRVSKCQSLPD